MNVRAKLLPNEGGIVKLSSANPVHPKILSIVPLTILKYLKTD